MASVKILEKFNNKVIKDIVALGAIPYDKTYHQPRYEIMTKAGRLQITLHIPEYPEKVFSIYAMFDDPNKASEIIPSAYSGNLNKWSGKWNFHDFNEDDTMKLFLAGLKEIL